MDINLLIIISNSTHEHKTLQKQTDSHKRYKDKQYRKRKKTNNMEDNMGVNLGQSNRVIYDML